MNLPLHKIHDNRWSYGRLIFPWFGKDRWGKRRWVGTFKQGLKRTDFNGFHNCTATGIY